MNATRSWSRTISVVAALIWFAITPTTSAETLPQRGVADVRLRTATYNPDEV